MQRHCFTQTCDGTGLCMQQSFLMALYRSSLFPVMMHTTSCTRGWKPEERTDLSQIKNHINLLWYLDNTSIYLKAKRTMVLGDVLWENSKLFSLQFRKSICVVFFLTSLVSWEWMLLTNVSVRSSRNSTRMGRSTLMPIGPATLVKVFTSSSAWSVARRGKKTAQQFRGTWQRGIMGQETERGWTTTWVQCERLGLSN